LKTHRRTDQGIRPVFGEDARMASLRARQDRANQYCLELAPTIKGLLASGQTSLRQIASGLNAKGIPAPRGGRWQKFQVDRVMRRIGLMNIFLNSPGSEGKRDR
jgi:Recombinase